VLVNYTRRRYETLQLATTGTYRLVAARVGAWTRYRVLRVLKDSSDQSLEPGAAANGEAQAVLDLLRGGALSAPTSPREPVTLTRTGHELLAAWTERWRRQRRGGAPGAETTG
jgi:hypothetical protein